MLASLILWWQLEARAQREHGKASCIEVTPSFPAFMFVDWPEQVTTLCVYHSNGCGLKLIGFYFGVGAPPILEPMLVGDWDVRE